MPSPRLLAVLTAFMVVAGADRAGAAYTLAQLVEIERFITGRDCGGLWQYLHENPELLEGDDPLAQELRNFNSGIEGGLIKCLSVGPGIVGGRQDFATRGSESY